MPPTNTPRGPFLELFRGNFGVHQVHQGDKCCSTYFSLKSRSQIISARAGRAGLKRTEVSERSFCSPVERTLGFAGAERRDHRHGLLAPCQRDHHWSGSQVKQERSSLAKVDLSCDPSESRAAQCFADADGRRLVCSTGSVLLVVLASNLLAMASNLVASLLRSWRCPLYLVANIAPSNS